MVYLFQGGRYDSVTGLYNFERRDYSLTLQQWIQTDPVASDNNSYRYLMNNPINFHDPQGLKVTCRGGGFEFTVVMGGNLNICYCFDECGNWGWLALPRATAGLASNFGYVVSMHSGGLKAYVQGTTWDVEGGIPFSPVAAGLSKGTGGAGNGIHSGLGLGAGVSGGYGQSQLLKGDLTKPYPC